MSWGVQSGKECERAERATADVLSARPRYCICVYIAGLAQKPVLIAVDDSKNRVTHYFLERVSIPRLSAKSAQVHTIIVKYNTDDSGSIGQAICDYVQKHEPAALVMMKENKGAIASHLRCSELSTSLMLKKNKSALARFFVGSVTRYCATHSKIPVVIVPEGSEEPPATPAAEPALHSHVT